MLAIDAIHRVSLSIIVIAGVALAAEGLAAEAKVPDKTAAGTPAPVIQSGSGTATLTLTPQRGSTTFSGIIVDGAGQAGPTIQGAGTEFSPGTSTYSGITTITAGTLDLTAGKPAPPEAMPAVRGKGYYVITEGAGLGDNVRKLPFTGDETVLDAISQIGGLSQLSSTKIWIARPSAADPKKGTILPVDWEAISRKGINATNYPLLAGDRVFIAEDSLVAQNNKLNKTIAPAERLLGFISLAESTLRGLLPGP